MHLLVAEMGVGAGPACHSQAHGQVLARMPLWVHSLESPPSQHGPQPQRHVASGAPRLLGRVAAGEPTSPEEPRGVLARPAGELCVCELVPKASPGLLASDGTGTRGHVRANRAVCQRKMRTLS